MAAETGRRLREHGAAAEEIEAATNEEATGDKTDVEAATDKLVEMGLPITARRLRRPSRGVARAPTRLTLTFTTPPRPIWRRHVRCEIVA